MGMTVRKTNLDFRDVRFTTREDMAAVGQMLMRRIVDRTARGVDAEGNPFAPYTTEYGEAKRKAIRSSGTVDLTVSGEMLRAMTLEATDKTVSLFFAR
jgi:hypothetical protein